MNTSISAVALLFASSLVAPLCGASDHDPYCYSAWEASSAKRTCTVQDGVSRSGDSCDVYVRCSDGQGGTRINHRWIQLGTVKSLSNNGGVLTGGTDLPPSSPPVLEERQSQ